MRGVNTAFRLLSGLLTLVLVLLLAGNLYILGARALTGELQPTVLGFSTAVVVTGSMSPAIEAGDLILCRRAPSYRVGDVVCFLSESGSSVITHRIIEETADGFVTQGDANNTPDSGILTQEQIVGRVVATIPGFGQVLEGLRSPLGLCLLALTGFVLYEFPRWAERPQRKRKGGREYGTHSQ